MATSRYRAPTKRFWAAASHHSFQPDWPSRLTISLVILLTKRPTFFFRWLTDWLRGSEWCEWCQPHLKRYAIKIKESRETGQENSYKIVCFLSFRKLLAKLFSCCRSNRKAAPVVFVFSKYSISFYMDPILLSACYHFVFYMLLNIYLAL